MPLTQIDNHPAPNGGWTGVMTIRTFMSGLTNGSVASRQAGVVG